MRWSLVSLPLVLPAMLVWAVLAVALSRRLGRWLRCSRWLAAFLLLAVGLIVAATLLPNGAMLAGHGSTMDHCDLSRMGLPPLSVLLRPNETSLNVLLFVPLGVALGALPRSRRGAGLIVAALLLPWAIELTQLAVPVLGRSCQSADIIDNTLGLVLGLLLGLGGRWLTGLGQSST